MSHTFEPSSYNHKIKVAFIYGYNCSQLSLFITAGHIKWSDCGSKHLHRFGNGGSVRGSMIKPALEHVLFNAPIACVWHQCGIIGAVSRTSSAQRTVYIGCRVSGTKSQTHRTPSLFSVSSRSKPPTQSSLAMRSHLPLSSCGADLRRLMRSKLRCPTLPKLTWAMRTPRNMQPRW